MTDLNPIDKLRHQAKIAREGHGMVVLTAAEAEAIVLFVTGSCSVAKLTDAEVIDLMNAQGGTAVFRVDGSADYEPPK